MTWQQDLVLATAVGTQLVAAYFLGSRSITYRPFSSSKNQPARPQIPQQPKANYSPNHK